MEYLKLPHLPERKVKKIIAAGSCPKDILHEVEMLGIETVLMPANPKIKDATADHPDMNILHVADNSFICASHVKEFCNQNLIGATVDVYQGDICSPYPNDAALNVARVAKNVFLCPKSTNEQMFEKDECLHFIYVKQGYTKCNIAIVSEDAIITEDKGIYNAAMLCGLDALLLKSGSVSLTGYTHGFIGGACGKLDADVLALTGSLTYISESDALKSFCRNHGVYITELSRQMPCDLGSILPISYD